MSRWSLIPQAAINDGKRPSRSVLRIRAWKGSMAHVALGSEIEAAMEHDSGRIVLLLANGKVQSLNITEALVTGTPAA